MRITVILLCFMLGSCVGIPKGVEPVSPFSLDRYLGTWYEIARLDHSFERGLEQVTADYSLRKDGSVKVINRGFNSADKQWEEAEGKAYFVNDENTGHLKVSFFGPFYASYVVFELGENYEYSLVTSKDKSYVWLLSRTPTLDSELQKSLVARLASLGFDTQDLIYVEQSTLAPLEPTKND